jgi:hypothetical protein
MFVYLIPAFAASQPSPLAQPLLADINQQRVAAGEAALADDPRLDAIAQARAQYMVSQGIFSHCVGNEADVQCSQTGYDFPGRAANAGIGLQQAGSTWAENIALNNHSGDAAAQTVQDWMNSPEHRQNILDPSLTYTGVAVVCCFSGVVGGQNILPSYNASIFVEDFTGGPGASPAVARTVAPSSGGPCTYVLGFATLANDLGPIAGRCADNEGHNPANGDAVQHTTTGGLLVWRKADNWTAFTDGFHTWINGPYGLVERLNTQRFVWEANPTGLPVIR